MRTFLFLLKNRQHTPRVKVRTKIARSRRVAATIATTTRRDVSEGGVVSEVSVLIESVSKLVDTVLVVSEPISAI